MISLFLEKTKINTELIHSFGLEREASQKILMILAKFSKHILFEKGKEMFKLGDPNENFFIIFSGSIKAHKLSKHRTFLTRPDYIKKLFELKRNNDIFILRKTLSFNRNLDVNEYEIERLNEKLVKIEAIKHEVNLKTHKKLFISNKYAGTFEEYVKDIENGEVSENISDEEIKSRFYENSYPSPIEKMDDERVFDRKNHKGVLFFYEAVSVLKEGDYFAESGENPNRRKHYRYYIPEADCVCLSISNGIFQKFISCEIQKMQNREILFLNENHIFKGIQRATFLNNYLKYFAREEFVLGNVVFQEEQALEKIYFVKEGKIELNLNTNFLSLNQYANELLNAHEVIKASLKEFPLNAEIRNQPKYFMENLKKKQHYSIFLLGENDIIGLEEAKFDFKRLCTTCVKSEKALLYSIPIKKFKKILDLEPKSKEQFEINSLMKMSNFVKRLLTLKNNNLHFFDDKYTKDFLRYYKAADVSKSGLNTGTLKSSILDFNKNSEAFFSEENNGNVKESIKKYFNEFNDLSKHLKKKYELILNPQDDLYTFYNDFNYENSTIKNIKKEIDYLKNNSVSKMLPDINLNSYNTQFNFSLNVNKIRNINTYASSRDHINDTTIIPNTNTIENLDSNKNKNSNNYLEKLNSSRNINLDKSLNNTLNEAKKKPMISYNKASSNKSPKKNFHLKTKATKNSTFFMTNQTSIKSDSSALKDFSFKNNELSKINFSKTNLINDSQTNFSTYNNNSTNIINNNNNNTNTRLMKKTFNNNSNSNFSLESSNHLKNNKSEPFNVFNHDEFNNNNKYDKKGNFQGLPLTQSKLQSENSKLNLNSNNKNPFVPFCVDNSIKTIKNQDKKLQMSIAKRVYKNQSLYNLNI